MEINTQPVSLSTDEVPPGFLSELPPHAALALLASGHAVTYPRGSVIVRGGSRPRPSMVTAGRIRLFLESADGRQATVGYAGPGDVVGLASSFLGEVHVDVKALTEASLVHFSPTTLADLMRDDSRVAVAVARKLAESLQVSNQNLRGLIFSTARQRLAQLLLSLAEADVDGAPVVRITHYELADAVGTVREHVARVMRQLREEGMVSTSRTRIVITDVAALKLAAAARDRLPQNRSIRHRADPSSRSGASPGYRLLGSSRC